MFVFYFFIFIHYAVFCIFGRETVKNDRFIINADIFEVCMNKITKSIAKEYFIKLNINPEIDYESNDFDEFLHFDYSNYNENSIYNVTKAQELLVYKLNSYDELELEIILNFNCLFKNNEK